MSSNEQVRVTETLLRMLAELDVTSQPSFLVV